MAGLSYFWSGAVQWSGQIDFWSLRKNAGSWRALEEGGEDVLVMAGVAADRAKKWAGSEEITTVGQAVTMASPVYPSRLRNCPWAPPVFFVEGDVDCFEGPAMAIVGTRRCTAYGAGLSRRLAAGLAAGGWSIVSGLARGIDGCAHRSALVSGRTVAVLGHGLGHTSPVSHRGLRRDIVAAGGLVVSEWPDAVGPRPFRFPRRNRWIAGLSDAVIVVEAPERSGALITARLAAEIGRDVWAVPGTVDLETSRGCNRLISEGAGVIWDVEEMLDYWMGVRGPHVERWVSWILNGVSVEDAAKRAGRSVTSILSDLSEMELAGAVIRLPGQRYAPGPMPS